MTFAFGLEGYRSMVRWFLERNYTVVDYAALDPARRHLILRHDVDFGLPFAVEIGALEQDMGVRSVHFVQLRSEFYNPFTPAARAMLCALRAQGHAIGLHFDPRASETVADLETHIATDAALLVAASGGPVDHVSFHRPPREHLAGALQLGGLWNAYAARFTIEAGYCSDSRGAWGHGDPFSHPAVKESRALQLLTHPIWWTGNSEDPQGRLRQFMAESLTVTDQEIALNCEIHEPGHARIAFRKRMPIR